jgi:flagellar P-ring protein precursor FlgI
MLPHTHRWAALLGAVLLLFTTLPAAAQQDGSARLKDLVTLEGASPVQLTGYGIVVGLDRTGDRARGRRGAAYTVQSITNMLKRFGIAVDPELLSSRNAAAVMVTAILEPFSGPGSTLDVTVSALGDARSLSGGVLLQTPLVEASSNQMYAMAQGPIATGAVLASSAGSSVKINNTNTGRIPNGAIVQQPPPFNFDGPSVGLVLRRPDFTNAERIAEAIEEVFPDAANVQHAGLVQVEVPDVLNSPSELMASLEGLTVEVNVPARVVINERTGTIVAGGNIRISEVMVTYGSLIVSTQRQPVISQPAPFAEEGETVQDEVGSAQVEEEGVRTVVLEPNTDVNQLAAALNELGLTARDVISIFQSIDRAGALQGQLVIL